MPEKSPVGTTEESGHINIPPNLDLELSKLCEITMVSSDALGLSKY